MYIHPYIYTHVHIHTCTCKVLLVFNFYYNPWRTHRHAHTQKHSCTTCTICFFNREYCHHHLLFWNTNVKKNKSQTELVWDAENFKNASQVNLPFSIERSERTKENKKSAFSVHAQWLSNKNGSNRKFHFMFCFLSTIN